MASKPCWSSSPDRHCMLKLGLSRRGAENGPSSCTRFLLPTVGGLCSYLGKLVSRLLNLYLNLGFLFHRLFYLFDHAQNLTFSMRVLPFSFFLLRNTHRMYGLADFFERVFSLFQKKLRLGLCYFFACSLGIVLEFLLMFLLLKLISHFWIHQRARIVQYLISCNFLSFCYIKVRHLHQEYS